jgi:hypothetical protein
VRAEYRFGTNRFQTRFFPVGDKKQRLILIRA